MGTMTAEHWEKPQTSICPEVGHLWMEGSWEFSWASSWGSAAASVLPLESHLWEAMEEKRIICWLANGSLC